MEAFRSLLLVLVLTAALDFHHVGGRKILQAGKIDSETAWAMVQIIPVRNASLRCLTNGSLVNRGVYPTRAIQVPTDGAATPYDTQYSTQPRDAQDSADALLQTFALYKYISQGGDASPYQIKSASSGLCWEDTTPDATSYTQGSLLLQERPCASATQINITAAGVAQLFYVKKYRGGRVIGVDPGSKCSPPPTYSIASVKSLLLRYSSHTLRYKFAFLQAGTGTEQELSLTPYLDFDQGALRGNPELTFLIRNATVAII